MELRQLRYFVAVAEELHYGRAAQRLHISGPALSQQILALERQLGADLFVRDRRSVRLTGAGRTLLGDARRMLALADDAKRRVQQAASVSAPVRLGYVSWLPEDPSALPPLVGSAVALRIDDWVLPSHVQADRVAEGTLDIALAWVTAAQAKALGLTAHLLYAEPLHAVVPGAGAAEAIAAAEVRVLVDADESAWLSWNRFAADFAADTGARVVEIRDGGIAGDAFFGHVRRIGAAVLASPKRHTAVMPPSLGQRPVADPIPLWTWSLLHRDDDDRDSVRHVVESLLGAARRQWPIPPAHGWWTPSDDPHRCRLTSGADLR